MQPSKVQMNAVIVCNEVFHHGEQLHACTYCVIRYRWLFYFLHSKKSLSYTHIHFHDFEGVFKLDLHVAAPKHFITLCQHILLLKLQVSSFYIFKVMSH